MTLLDEYGDPLECLDGPNDDCKGPVEYRCSPGIKGKAWPRCEYHIERRFANYEKSSERYADSDMRPAWFDEADIDERWGPDDY